LDTSLSSIKSSGVEVDSAKKTNLLSARDQRVLALLQKLSMYGFRLLDEDEKELAALIKELEG
jgi:hypothetical protein